MWANTIHINQDIKNFDKLYVWIYEYSVGYTVCVYSCQYSLRSSIANFKLKTRTSDIKLSALLHNTCWFLVYHFHIINGWMTLDYSVIMWTFGNYWNWVEVSIYFVED